MDLSKINQINVDNHTACLVVKLDSTVGDLEEHIMTCKALQQAFPDVSVITILGNTEVYSWDLDSLKDYVIKLEEIIAERECAEAAD